MALESNQLARIIYHRWMSSMKFALDIEEQKYEKGRNDQRFKFFKKLLMANTYQQMRELFAEIETLGVIEAANNEDVKDGYRDTDSGGSGYINTSDFDTWLTEEEE